MRRNLDTRTVAKPNPDWLRGEKRAEGEKGGEGILKEEEKEKRRQIKRRKARETRSAQWRDGDRLDLELYVWARDSLSQTQLVVA